MSRKYVKVETNSPYVGMAYSNGYAPEHRIVMAKHLGRCLTPNEFIHHRNNHERDNRLDNLELTTNKKHSLHHANLRSTNIRNWKLRKACSVLSIDSKQKFNEY